MNERTTTASGIGKKKSLACIVGEHEYGLTKVAGGYDPIDFVYYRICKLCGARVNLP